jgi:hypothetical protein
VNLERLQSFFNTSPAAKLLRSPHAAQIIYFLFRHFKETGAITWPQSQLQQRLSEYLEQIHETEPEILRERADAYLTAWSTGDSRWLRRFFDTAHAEPVYELTPHTEDVLRFLSEALNRNVGFVGTESRLKRIIDTLSDIVVRGSDDPARRLEHLRAERARLDREIESIESGGAVATYSSTAIRERFVDAVADLGSLLGDFRAVEDRFKDITRDVQRRQAEVGGERGEILGFALAAEDSLKSQDQGISFDEFVRLILSPSKQEQLETIFARLREIEALVEQVEGMRQIHGMIGSLSGEAEKVLRTIRRLSSTLRRLLDSKVTSTRMRLAQVLRDIRSLAARLADEPLAEDFGLELSSEVELLNVSERPFWTAPTTFEPLALADHKPDEDDRRAAFRHLAALQRLDWETMKLNISQMLRDQPRLPLPTLLAAHPPHAGAIEILGYLQIAHDEGHWIDQSVKERIPVSSEGNQDHSEVFEVPQVVFLGDRFRLRVAGSS